MSARCSGCPQEGGWRGGLKEEKSFWRIRTCRAVAAATHATPCSAWLIHDHRWPPSVMVPDNQSNQTGSLLTIITYRIALFWSTVPDVFSYIIGCSCSWNLIRLLAPVYYRCFVISVAVQTVAAVVLRRRCIGIHSHMTTDEWWIVDWTTLRPKWRERRRGEKKTKGKQSKTLYMQVWVHPYKVRTFQKSPCPPILLFAIQHQDLNRYALLHHH